MGVHRGLNSNLYSRNYFDVAAAVKGNDFESSWEELLLHSKQEGSQLNNFGDVLVAGGDPLIGIVAGVTGIVAGETPALQAAVQTAENLLKTFATDPDFAGKMGVAFGDRFNVASADGLAKAWAVRDFRSFPKIEIRNSAEINGALGAFAGATNKIYLSREFLTENDANTEAVASVLLEEFGHAVDTQLNDADTPGDEGEIFSALVRSEKLEAEQLQQMKAEDDTATITLDGQQIQIEQATINLNQTINESLSSTDPDNPTRTGRFTDEYTLSGVSDWQQIQVNLDSSDFDSFLQLVNASTGVALASNDDSGGGQNSQLSFTVFPGVNYLIRATSFNSGATGNYTFNTSSLGTGSSLIATLNGQVGTVDSLGRFTQIATGSGFFDIALSNNGQLFGINSSQLYRIDPGNGSSSLIGNFGISQSLNALEFSSSNVLYGAGGSNLYTIDTATGTASLVANLGSEFSSSGDLIFDGANNRLLATSRGGISDSLYSVSLTGQATKIGDIGFSNVFGLSFENGTLFGFTEDRQRIVINPVTGSGAVDRNITGLSDRIGGSASIPTNQNVPPVNPDTTPTDPIVPPVNPGTLSFSNAEFRVNEDGTVIAAVTVNRSGGSDGAVSATVNLSNGNALAPDDYGNAPITVNFDPGETQQTITIPIINDALDENDETIALTLANPTGGAAIGQQNSATLVIVDNDDSVAAPGQVVDLAPLQIKVVGGNFTRNNTTNRFETSSNVQIGLKPKEGEIFKPLIAVQQGKVEYDDKTLNVDATVFSSIGNVAAPLF